MRGRTWLQYASAHHGPLPSEDHSRVCAMCLSAPHRRHHAQLQHQVAWQPDGCSCVRDAGCGGGGLPGLARLLGEEHVDLAQLACRSRRIMRRCLLRRRLRCGQPMLEVPDWRAGRAATLPRVGTTMALPRVEALTAAVAAVALAPAQSPSCCRPSGTVIQAGAAINAIRQTPRRSALPAAQHSRECCSPDSLLTCGQVALVNRHSRDVKDLPLPRQLRSGQPVQAAQGLHATRAAAGGAPATSCAAVSGCALGRRRAAALRWRC